MTGESRERFADTGPGYRRRTTHELLAASTTSGINMDTVIDPGMQVIFYKPTDESYFWIAMEEVSVTKAIKNPATVKALRDASAEMDSIVIGVISQDGGDPEQYTAEPAVSGDTELMDLVDRTSSRFWQLIDSYRAWDSLAAYLLVDDRYDVASTEPLRQVPLDYWCLVGPTTARTNWAVEFLPDWYGVFVYPEDHLIPVFTSAIFADIVAQEILSTYRVRLHPRHLPCAGCHLSGIRRNLRGGVLRGAVVNGQWRLDCYTCGEHPESVGHFFLHDVDGSSYRLYGCKDMGIGPIWWEKRWDTDGEVFSTKCKPFRW